MLIRSDLLTASCLLLLAFCRHDGVDGAVDHGGNKEGTEFWGYVHVRPGAHMFYWLFHSYHADGYLKRPLILWLQGGPGASSCAYGNFGLIGPLDGNFNERSTTWVKEANVLFVDSPVGSGYSYVDDPSRYTTDIQQITDDLTELTKQFMNRYAMFKKIPLYVFGQSYGGKAAAHFAQYLYREVQKGAVEANLVAFAMGNAWVSPIDSTTTWGPLLYQMSLVDSEGMEAIQADAEKSRQATLRGEWERATDFWRQTQMTVFDKTNGVNFYNIHKFYVDDDDDDSEELQLMLNAGGSSKHDFATASAAHDSLKTIMEGEIKRKIGVVPPNVTWGAQSGAVFRMHKGDFMKDVIYAVEYALENTTLDVIVYQGQLDLICDVVGAMNWVQSMTLWRNLQNYNAANRTWFVNGVSRQTEMYVKEFDRFHFYWVLRGGHSIAKDNGVTAYRMMRRIIGEPDRTITTPAPFPASTVPLSAPSTRSAFSATVAALAAFALLLSLTS